LLPGSVLSKIFILLILFLFAISCTGNLEKSYQVTFQVHVRKPVKGQKVYITGNQPELSNWTPGKITLHKVNDSLFTKTFSFKDNTELQFKITAGDWWLQAVDSNYHNYQNFTLKVKSDTVFSVKVFDWRNEFKNGIVVFNQKRFLPNREYMSIDNYWKYHAGDNFNWSKADFNDSNWTSVNSYLDWASDTIPKWENIGWFRFHFIVDSSLWNKSLGLLIGQLGASQIYYNGRLLYSFGEIGNSQETFKPSQVRIWKEFNIDPKTDQIFAVRYANYFWKQQKSEGFSPGFVIYLKDINSIFEETQQNIRGTSYHQMIFTMIPLILFFFHLFIFAFNPKEKENLYYAVCLLGFAGITFFGFERFISSDPALIVLYYRLNGVSVPTAIFFSLMTFYAIAYLKTPKRWKLYFIIFILLLLLNYFLIPNVGVINYIFFGIVALDIIISSFNKKNKKRLKGIWIISTGLIILFLFIIIQILLDYSLISPLTDFNQVFVYGMIGFIVSMSLFLSYNFSQINKDLKIQLVKVKELSEKTIEQERTAKEKEMQQRLLEADNERKTKELEEARKLQKSMLPSYDNDFQEYDIYFKMRPATEIGGDYYDYLFTRDNTLNIAIGDATDHGMKSALMVAIVKSLFNSFGTNLLITDFFNRSTELIKRMKLGNLFMSLSILRIKNNQYHLSSAGMPPMFIYRKKSNKIEQILLKGMPLGGYENFPYSTNDGKLESGDTILLISDGLSELFNKQKQMLGYENISKCLLENAPLTAKEIGIKLFELADKWLNSSSQNDDITVAVIKIK